MFRPALCLWCSVLYLVQAENVTGVLQAENDTSVQSCSSGYTYVGTNTTINITESCNDEKPCIAKCCPHNQILLYKPLLFDFKCVDITNLTISYKRNNLHDYSGIEFYGNNINKSIMKSSKTMNDFTHIYSADLTNFQCSISTQFIFGPPKNQMYILENGYLRGRRVNYVNQWFLTMPPGDFCVENQLVENTDGSTSLEVAIWTRYGNSENKSIPKNSITAYAMLVSCFFLLLVLLVYALLPQLRNLAGMMLMAYVSTLIIGFICRAVQVIGSDSHILHIGTCRIIGCIMYFGIIGSFTWMNVMSFDIWWSMRGFRKMRQIHRRGILVKFGWYSLYAWGVPLALLLFIIIVDHIDLTNVPNFITPHLFGNQCFMNEDERQVYMNGPILVATCINIVLFLMTAYNIWRIKTGVSKHSAGESRKNKQDEVRFGIYLRLSLVMGIFWILEVVSASFFVDAWAWYISDIFNCLIGLFVFLIFVFKRNILVLLCKRFSIAHDFVQKWQPTDSTRSHNTRLNSKKKMLDSVTESSDVEV